MEYLSRIPSLSWTIRLLTRNLKQLWVKETTTRNQLTSWGHLILTLSMGRWAEQHKAFLQLVQTSVPNAFQMDQNHRKNCSISWWIGQTAREKKAQWPGPDDSSTENSCLSSTNPPTRWPGPAVLTPIGDSQKELGLTGRGPKLS